ncbi:MAG: NTP transferase domain-containing protein [Micrococcales bacterium]|nr:NTP transferase domain-containing protein [Micrococcales bacterium]
MRRTRVVIQSRLNSSRLPGKAMMTVAGMPLIELVARRASRSGHEVVVATSEEPYDERIAHHLETVGIRAVRGPLDDVLGRFVMATSDLDDDDRVVRLTGDNPIADAALVDELLAAMDESGHVYGRVDIDQAPEGIGCEGFTARALREAAATTAEPYDREHVTPWLRRALGELLFVPEGCPSDLRGFRATIDCLDDFDRVTRLFDGVDDPIGVGWLELMLRLQERLDVVGPVVPLAPGRPFSRLLVATAAFGRGGEDRPEATQARAILADAVTRGVTHIEGGLSDGDGLALARAASEPALTQRLGLLARIGGLGDGPAAGGRESVELAMQRALFATGRRRADAWVLESASHAAGEAWQWLRELAGDALLGVRVSTPDELAAVRGLPGLALVEVARHLGDPAWDDAEDLLTEVHDAGLSVLAVRVLDGGALAADPGGRLGAAAAELGRAGAVDLAIGEASGAPWCDAVVVGCDDAEQFRADADAVSRPLDAPARARLRELLG